MDTPASAIRAGGAAGRQHHGHGAKAGHADEDIAANDPEVLGAVLVDTDVLLARDGSWPGLLITQMKEDSGQAILAERSQLLEVIANQALNIV